MVIRTNIEIRNIIIIHQLNNNNAQRPFFLNLKKHLLSPLWAKIGLQNKKVFGPRHEDSKRLIKQNQQIFYIL